VITNCDTRFPLRVALLAFKKSLSSSDAVKLSAWVEGTDHCDGTWLGVQCLSRKPKRVYMLDLSDQGMLFPVSSIDFAALPALQVLWLQGNSITDNLQAFAVPGSFSRLVELRMHDAGLTGTLPSSLPTKLKRLHLQNNQLSGTLPAELSALDLEVLLLDNNNLQGSVPESWKGLTKLKAL
jgi:brassinosteroid insensitive 1-associated receptor kinase 1/somatic embryogenesis receptor kinase 4